ncbi:acetyl-CoA C-acyltransferase [Ruegeria sp. EL01]|jgi:acetyl-CoA C-acetyltransferase|uniref:thiolase family protein n=1 Tax=Ruegeria sp. EL01 TaxID=2107578 RepID=UPI000EA82891|nr:acetyl-CoA C-acyltransferase [Ruegeria sp. EL01]
MKEVVIAGAARTPMGGFQGVFDGVTAAELGGSAANAALQQSGARTVDEMLMGCVLPAGQGQAPARQAGFAAGLGDEVPATTLNKMCGSGMKAAMIAFDQIALGHTNTMIAGGMESMTNAPYLLPKMRGGARIGHGQVVDHMFLDGLEDAYDKGRLMGTFAEDCAEAYQFTREAQDEYALQSLSNALAAQDSGAFEGEITPFVVRTRKGDLTQEIDEQPKSARPEKIPTLKPAFRKDGTVTAANSSSISDGAAALVLASAEVAEAQGLNVRARILGHASHAQAPGLFTTAPVPAVQKLLDRIGWTKEDVDLWEVNEAFAVVPMAFMHEMGLPRDKVNVNGGACALGHPIGASGARIMVTLLNALEKRNLKRGVAAICIGGGEGTAIAIERV